MSKYILSIDQGTTSTRSIVFNNKFEIVSFDQIELKQYFPKDGCVEHDPKEIFETVLKTSKNAIKKSNIKPTDISAIGITNQRETTVLWDKETGEPVYKAIVWQDRRTVNYCKELQKKGYTKKIQKITEDLGGCVSDSLQMAKFGKDSDSNILVVSGVKFMGETAKILSPEKRVFMPTLEATCSLDLGCPVDDFKLFCEDHPDREIVVYANTSADVKAIADWVVTSSIALDVIDFLDSEGKKIIWGPDKHLGNYIQQKTKADMIMWDGACVVHEEFKHEGLKSLMNLHKLSLIHI